MTERSRHRARAQVVALVALALPVLIGFLGLALDGGYFFLASRALTIAADAAARAAAVDTEDGRYSVATTNGQQVAQTNLAPLALTGITISLAYNDTPSAAPTASGWAAGPPTSSTRSVRATASGTYNTLFMRMLGVPSVDVQRVGTAASSPVVTFTRVLPVAACQLTRTLTPLGPWTIWSNLTNLCSLTWHGLVNVTGSATCTTYDNWIGPPVSGPVPADGSTMTLDPSTCSSNFSHFQNLVGTTQTIMVVDTLAGNTLVGCQSVTISTLSVAGLDTVLGTPAGSLGSCSVLQIN